MDLLLLLAGFWSSSRFPGTFPLSKGKLVCLIFEVCLCIKSAEGTLHEQTLMSEAMVGLGPELGCELVTTKTHVPKLSLFPCCLRHIWVIPGLWM